MDGQKVVKVFCHEEAAMAEFHEVNESPATQRRQGQRLRQPADAGKRQYRQYQLCAWLPW